MKTYVQRDRQYPRLTIIPSTLLVLTQFDAVEILTAFPRTRVGKISLRVSSGMQTSMKRTLSSRRIRPATWAPCYYFRDDQHVFLLSGASYLLIANEHTKKSLLLNVSLPIAWEGLGLTHSCSR